MIREGRAVVRGAARRAAEICAAGASSPQGSPEDRSLRSHDPRVRLPLDQILVRHGEVLQEFSLRPRATRRA